MTAGIEPATFAFATLYPKYPCPAPPAVFPGFGLRSASDRCLVLFVLVVAIGGSRGIAGAFFGALLLGVLDVAGKYYVPSIGAFVIYAVMVATLLIRPQGLFAKSGT